MAAHYWRETTGKGQWVDVSMQQSVVGLGMTAPSIWELSRINVRRGGSVRVTQRRLEDGTIKTTRARSVWPTKDGYVEANIMGGAVGASSSRALVEAMDSVGMAPEELRGKDWDALDMQSVTQEEIDIIAEPMEKYFATHTSMEIYEEAVKRRIILAPLSTTKQLLENAQLAYRGAWEQMEHPELGTYITYPGVWAWLTETPLALRRRAPLIGEHNREIYEYELGITPERLTSLKSCGAI
jgi:benzylsuccinate CoA-transferase BbsE subunit